MVDKAEELDEGLQKIGFPIKHFNVWFVYLVVRRLDPATRESWAIHEEDVEGFSTFASLSKFLENRVVLLTPAPVLLEEASDQTKTSQKEFPCEKKRLTLI